ncbi:MAG: MinD/ParA family protein [Woeseiaceae bacterium]|nr:MinD/ParA family protein [Woeseiaceae bacterium]
MRDAIQAETLRRRLQRVPTKVVAVCSGKGGVGKTNVAANVAVALGRLGRDVCLLDADVSLANVDVLLGLQPRFNLAHVVSGDVDLETTLMRGPANLRIVPASSGSYLMTDLPPAAQAAIIQAFSDLSRHPDVLVVDTAAGIAPGVARFVQAAQYALVVVQDEPASLTDAYALIKVFSQNYGVSHFSIVTNQSATRGRRLYAKLRAVTDRYLDVVLRHLGDVPRDPWLARAVREQRAVVDAYPESPSAGAFAQIARSVDRLASQRSASGGIEFFFERLLGETPVTRGQVA